MSTPAEALDIQEAAAAPPQVKGDGHVTLHLIRPCVGRGKGRHVYEAGMLAENAHKFGGWRMFINHDTDQERRARGGLPRSVNDLGGIVTEAHWDPTVPAEGRFGAGAVVGTVKAVPKIVELLKVDPSLVESSINARATAVREVTREGGRAWLVEGIEPKGTVDWVTDGGAGGKVVESLLEAVAQGTTDEEEIALFESMTDDELREHLAKTRPGVLVVEAAKPKADDADDDTGDSGKGAAYDAEYKKLIAKGLPPALAKKAAAKHAADAASAKEGAVEPGKDDPDPKDEGGAVAQITTEQIQEALATPEAAEAIGKIAGEIAATKITEAVEAARIQARAEASADTDRAIEIRDMRDDAVAQIREAKLPAAFEARALAKFALVNGEPTDALDVFEATDEDGKLVKPLADVLREAVAEEIAEQRALVASLKPTRVTGQGTASPAGDGKALKEGEEQPKVDKLGPLTRSLMQEAGFNDPDKAFDSEFALRG